MVNRNINIYKLYSTRTIQLNYNQYKLIKSNFFMYNRYWSSYLSKLTLTYTLPIMGSEVPNEKKKIKREIQLKHF